MTIDEIKDELNTFGYDTSELRDLNKKQLTERLNMARQSNETLQTIEIDPSSLAIEDKTEQLAKNVYSSEKQFNSSMPEWTDYVMSLFQEKELDNGMPKVDGLRRVAELVYGSFDDITNIEQTPNIDNSYRATVLVTLHFPRSGRTYSGAADAFAGNTDKKFAMHPIAIAETRAEGRALRKALKLTKIVTAEELQGADKDEPNGTDNRINTQILNSLNVMCDRLGVDLHKLSVKLGYEIGTVEDLTQKQGLDIAKVLGSYSRQEVEIPQEIKKG
jgi:hypothetical protein